MRPAPPLGQEYLRIAPGERDTGRLVDLIASRCGGANCIWYGQRGASPVPQSTHASGLRRSYTLVSGQPSAAQEGAHVTLYRVPKYLRRTPAPIADDYDWRAVAERVATFYRRLAEAA